MLTALDMIDAVKENLEGLFRGFMLPNKAGNLQEVRIFTQYMPPPAGITVAGEKPTGTKGYNSEDFSMNFPGVIIKLGEMTDSEERRLDLTKAGLRLLFGVCEWEAETGDEESDSRVKNECWRDVLLMMERVRQSWLRDRIIGRKFKILLPVVMNLLEEDTYPLYFGELKTELLTWLPAGNPEYVYRGILKTI